MVFTEIAKLLIDAGLVQGFFLAFLVLYKKKNNPANRILASLLIVFAVAIAHASFAGPHLRNVIRTPLEIKEPFVMLVAPLVWMYVNSIAGKGALSWGKGLLHFLPFVVFALFTLPFIIHRNDFNPDHIIFHNTTLFTFIAWCFIIVQFSFYLVRIQRLVRSHSQQVASELSNTEAVDLQWVKVFMLIFVLFYAFVLFTTFAQIHLTKLPYFNYAVGLLYTFSAFLIGYRGLFQRDVFFVPYQPPTPLSVKTSPTTKTTAAPPPVTNTPSEKELFARVQEYMDKHKPYLNTDLSLTELARQLKLNRNQLSHLINVNTNENFYTFVNTYRVEEVKQLLASPQHQHYTILTLAYEAGFSSKSSFNRIFKNITGSTPSEYQSSIHNK
ncbi:hypothetical protein BKI52_44105 [marine bacterium AO1-C]|nr:hypothetical protein BKI52_44105 [marine bacterium AO1-C]